ncbi:hypothetical protein Acid345_0029 [Candidatus Koribacter versatilis Ellin345]|uniref:Uncharacterized protein n=1 Tax=Koribacter versatilis (strain Ellin345) TaxID=204669 RepID=Q1IVR6_KORVE|nr:hypothetical protein [Candidatus Koribacter versatilis]ABF39034.1 hypothetical protein Acid345_0029 [Candidatus Koribacter versatilis Ellin345]
MRVWLRDRHVGAVLIAFLLYNFVTGMVRAVENPLLMWIQRWSQHSALSAGQPWYNKGQVFGSLSDAILFLIVSLLIAAWLYGGDKPTETKAKA